MNGALVDWKDANIHLASHVIHYGSGVFEGARCYDTKAGPACFRLDEHVRRLMESARIYRMDPPYDAATIRQAILETIVANNYRACYIRPLVYRGCEELGVNPFPCPVDVAILVWEWTTMFTAESFEHRAEHLAGAREERGELRQLSAHQDGGNRRGLQRSDRARPHWLAQRRQRPEHLSRTRRRAVHAPDGVIGALRYHTRFGHDDCP
jgi:branched-subunit amino acid aminotransferase/4-amino-4-deoxychorismate lyase